MASSHSPRARGSKAGTLAWGLSLWWGGTAGTLGLVLRVFPAGPRQAAVLPPHQRLLRGPRQRAGRQPAPGGAGFVLQRGAARCRRAAAVRGAPEPRLPAADPAVRCWGQWAGRCSLLPTQSRSPTSRSNPTSTFALVPQAGELPADRCLLPNPGRSVGGEPSSHLPGPERQRAGSRRRPAALPAAPASRLPAAGPGVRCLARPPSSPGIPGSDALGQRGDALVPRRAEGGGFLTALLLFLLYLKTEHLRVKRRCAAGAGRPAGTEARPEDRVPARAGRAATGGHGPAAFQPWGPAGHGGAGEQKGAPLL